MEIGCRPILFGFACEEELNDLRLLPANLSRGNALLEMLFDPVVFIPIGHLGPLARFLENNNQHVLFPTSGQELFVDHKERASGRKESFLFMEIGRKPPD